MWVNAPLEIVQSILDDVDHYKEIFPNFDDIHVVSRDRNRLETYWEQHIPLFFVPNTKYQMSYVVDHSVPDRVVYRYQLAKADAIKVDDGLIVIDKDPTPGSSVRTRYTEYDLFDADWGVLETIAPGKIWKESVEGFYLSDIAIKLKAEHFNGADAWSNKRVMKESKSILDRYPVDMALKSRKKFNPF